MSAPSPQQAAAARDRFRAIVEGPEDAIDPTEAALWIAAEHEAEPAPDEALAQLAALAERTRARVDAARPWPERVEAIARTLHEDEGLQGDEEEYYDPRNSFLGQVLQRGSGIPITLSLVFIDVCRRLGLQAQGIGFPGHFLARVAGEAGAPDEREAVVVDAFHGITLSRDDCEARLREMLGPEARLEAAHLEGARAHEILARILSNLKQIYLGRKELAAAVACCDRILLLAPDAAFELRDRGVLYHRLEFHHPAIADLSRFLELAPEHETADAIRRLLVDARSRAGALH